MQQLIQRGGEGRGLWNHSALDLSEGSISIVASPRASDWTILYLPFQNCKICMQ